ncbi:hypothetical protein EHS13_26015 [Paenibacillus psychroresistens]|uniref:SLH domain-containing protein n=1 Tax=Paenibacillus psychroresistens TaxID=1778678 RepID=A0A6B8RRT1_9BACL|nr:S-layer homology domain-containing protein [Paenibacillus psychroresistens]QGQ98096.1 hypothetical protein EHS13_26015 [Paenibacillus psychroresistens]
MSIKSFKRLNIYLLILVMVFPAVSFLNLKTTIAAEAHSIVDDMNDFSKMYQYTTSPPLPAPVSTTVAIANAGFESGELTPWSNWNTASVVNNNARTGTYALQLASGQGAAEQSITVQPNTTYVVSGFIKTENDETVTMGVKNHNGVMDQSIPFTSADYTEGAITFTTGSSNTSATIYVYKASGSGLAFGDDFTITTLTSPPPAIDQGENLVINPDFESGDLHPWSNWNAASVVNNNARTGTHALQLASGPVAVEQTIAVLPNTTYTLSGYVKTANNEGVTINVKNYNGEVPDISSASLTSSSYTQGTITFTTGLSNATATIYMLKGEGTNSAYLDDVKLTTNFMRNDANVFGNDSSRLVNTDLGSFNAIYHTPKNMTYFKLDSYEKKNQASDTLKFYTSMDGLTYEDIITTKSGGTSCISCKYSFENGIAGWDTWFQIGNGQQVASSSSEAQDGSKSVQLNNSVQGQISMWHDILTTGANNPAPNDHVKLTGWIKLAAGASVQAGQNLRIIMDYFDADNVKHQAFITTPPLSQQTQSEQWIKLESNTDQLPADTTKITIAVESTILGSVFLDNIELTSVSSLDDVDLEWKQELYSSGPIPANTKFLKVQLTKSHGSEPGIQIGRIETGYLVEPPVAKDANKNTFINVPVEGTINATDPNEQLLSFYVSKAPEHGTVNVAASSGHWSYTPETDYLGEDSFQVRVTNEDGFETTAKIKIDVLDAFTFQSIDFTDSSGNSVSELKPSSSIHASMELKNNTSSPKNAILVLALFAANHSVEKHVYMDVTLQADEVKMFNGGFDLPANVDGYYVKAFVLNDTPSDIQNSSELKYLSNIYRFPFDMDFESGIPENFIAKNGFSFTEAADYVIDGESSMLGDTTESLIEWNEYFHSAKGVLKPNTNYNISFDYKILDKPANTEIYYLFRSKSLQDAIKFTLMTAEPGVVKHIDQKVSIGDKTDYSLLFGIHNKGIVAVDNIHIMETNQAGYTAAAIGASSVQKNLTLPEGPGEIIIDSPHVTNGIVVNASEFGVSEANNDNYQAFTDAITYSKEHNASKMIVPKGIYHIRTNTLDFGDLTDFEFDGQGSELIFGKFTNPTTRLIYVHDSLRVVFKNVFVDWNEDEDPTSSRAQVVAVEPSGEYVDFKFPNYNTAVRTSNFRDFLPLDPQRLTIGVDGAKELPISLFASEREWIAEDTVRLRVNNPEAILDFAKVGNEYVLRHYTYDMHGIVMNNNAHLMLDNVVLYSIPGQGFLVENGQHHWQLLNCKVTRRPGTNRMMSSTADHYLAYNTKGYFIIQGCDFGFGGDDGINTHDNISMGITVINDHKFIVNNEKWRTPYKAGDLLEFRNSDLSPTGFTSEIVTAVWNGAENQGTITIADALSTDLQESSNGIILFNRAYDSGNYIIRNNYIHDNRARSILVQTPNGLIENNHFYRNEQPGMQIETGYDSATWAEGFGVNNVIIRNNIFDSTNVNTSFREKKPALYMSVYLPSGRSAYPIFNNILIENNTFKNFPGVSMFISSGKDIIVKGNSFINDARPEAVDKIRGGIYTEQSSDLTIINNKWIQSDQMKSYGLYYDKETTSNIVFEGNSIISNSNSEDSGAHPVEPTPIPAPISTLKPSPIPTLEPNKAAEILKKVEAELIDLFAKKPTNEDSQTTSRRATKAIQSAIEKQSELNVSNSVKVTGEVATLNIELSQFTDLFKTIQENARILNDKLKAMDESAEAAKVTVTFDLGEQASKEFKIPINFSLIQKAKEAGIDVVSIKVNGVSLSVDVDQLQGDTTLNIAKQPSSIAMNATELKLASDVYEFEFLDSGKNQIVFTKPVLIKLPIADITSLNTDILTLAKIVDGSLEFYGGQYNEENHYFEGTRKSFSTYVIVENKVVFNDISGVQAWAGRDIEIAAAKGILQGRTAGIYAPNDSVTRAEFAAMLVRAFNLEDSTAVSTFSDVNDNDWFKSSVAAAAKAGLLNGRSSDLFAPNEKISRAEMAAIAARALKAVKGFKNVDSEKALAKFQDALSIPMSLRDEVALAASLGIVVGTDHQFSPLGLSTRAQAAVVISRLLNQ